MVINKYFNKDNYIRDGQGYLCRFCQFRVYKYSWKKTKLNDALNSHMHKCSMRYLLFN